MSTPASTSTVTVVVNDQPRELDGAATVAALVSDLGLDARKGIAIAINGSVVPRAAWPGQPLAEGDRVLVIRATQGG
jgi:sulfur carrier protein